MTRLQLARRAISDARRESFRRAFGSRWFERLERNHRIIGPRSFNDADEAEAIRKLAEATERADALLASIAFEVRS